MIAIHRRLRKECLSARMLLQIHDELIFEVPSEQLQHLARLVREEMSGVGLECSPESGYQGRPQLGRCGGQQLAMAVRGLPCGAIL